jgi:hypothetical protein
MTLLVMVIQALLHFVSCRETFRDERQRLCSVHTVVEVEIAFITTYTFHLDLQFRTIEAISVVLQLALLRCPTICYLKRS